MQFNESAYLAANPDVAAAVAAGTFLSGYHHYTTNGIHENRNPNPAPPAGAGLFGLSPRALMIAAVIIGLAVWYAGHK